MNKPLTVELKQAQQIAVTAQVLAVVCLAILGIHIISKLGVPLANALFGESMPWRDEVRKIGLISIALIPTFFFFESISQLRHALKIFGTGEFFTTPAASRVANAGDYAIGAMISLMLLVPNFTLWASQRAGFEWRMESEYIGMLAFALFISVVGRVLAAASQIKAENDAFV